MAGQPAHRRAARASAANRLLFQDDLLFPHLSVAGNLKFALGLGKVGKAERRFASWRKRWRARACRLRQKGPGNPVGRATGAGVAPQGAAFRTARLLLDEPFSKLDPELRGQFRQYVFNEARLRMLPVIMVTHDPADRVAAGGKAVELKGSKSQS